MHKLRVTQMRGPQNHRYILCFPRNPLHPHPSQREQDLAHSLSSRLNEAYQCLLHPLPRAEYILEKNGLQTSETDQVEDMEFMANIMEARETIDDATPEHRGEVETLIESNQRMFQLHLLRFVLFQSYPLRKHQTNHWRVDVTDRKAGLASGQISHC